LAGAIHHAHQQGIIHRDLKPANVLLTPSQSSADQTAVMSGWSLASGLNDYVPKITDFGLAKFSGGSDLTQSGDVLGTPSYMAPEQTVGKSAVITAAVDVYGLGALLYEALTGRPPFQAETAVATVQQVRQADPVPPRRLQPTVPRDLETICLKCLRKEPGRRYATAKDLADDLRRFLAGEPVRARPLGTAERVVVWCRRKPAVAALLAALIIVFLAGSFGILWQWQSAMRERDTAKQERDRAQRHLKMIHDRVDHLNQLGRKLLGQPGQYRAGKEVLEEALVFYKDLLPEEGDDPKVRREAAMLYGEVAWIRHRLGQADMAAEAWDRKASLLTSLLGDEPTDKDLRLDLSHSHRWRGNMLRDLGKVGEAREAYNQAAEIQERLLSESSDVARYRMQLANTLLNKATLPWDRDQTQQLETLWSRIVELDQAAVDASPNDPQFSAELALALQDQGLFFLDIGRRFDAEASVREALKIHQRLLDGGRLKDDGYIERYLASNFTNLGRVLAASGKAGEAEESYRQAVNLLESSSKEFPYSAYHRLDLVRSYLQLVGLLCELGRQSDAAEPYRKALDLDSEDPAINNQLARFLATSPELPLRTATQATRLAKKAVDAWQESHDCWNTLGVAHYRDGDNRAAVAALEKAMSLRSGGNSFDWFFLAMAHWRLGERDKAQTSFDRAVQWMDKYKPHDDELRRFRAEADALMAETRKR